MLNPFVIHINERNYRIIPFWNDGYLTYDVSTDSGKLFTLEMSADGSWKPVEAGVIPGHETLIAEIGNAVIKQYTH